MHILQPYPVNWQETFDTIVCNIREKIHISVDKIPEKNTSTYIVKICENAIYDFIRRKKAEQNRTSVVELYTIDDSYPAPPDFKINYEFESFVNSITDNTDKAILEFKLMKMKYKEIAIKLNIKESTVKTRINRIQNKTRIYLKQNGL